MDQVQILINKSMIKAQESFLFFQALIFTSYKVLVLLDQTNLLEKVSSVSL